jgi:hypothetical protein
LTLKRQRNDPGNERITAQSQSQQKRETTNFRHEEGPKAIFSETLLRGNRKAERR